MKKIILLLAIANLSCFIDVRAMVQERVSNEAFLWHSLGHKDTPSLMFLAAIPYIKKSPAEIALLNIPQESKEHILNIKKKMGEKIIELAFQPNELLNIKRLIEAGADVNVKAKNRWGIDTTALFEATEGRQPALMQLLIDAGADVNAKFENGKNILSKFILFFSTFPSIDIIPEVKLLLDAGAYIDKDTISDYLINKDLKKLIKEALEKQAKKEQ